MRPLARCRPGALGSWLAGHCPWVLVWAGACYLLAQRGRVCVLIKFIIITTLKKADQNPKPRNTRRHHYVSISAGGGDSPQVRCLTVAVAAPMPTKKKHALGIERTRFIIAFSRVRAPQKTQSWGLGPPPSTCAQDDVLVFLASAPKKTRKGRFCVKRVRTANS